MILSESVTGTNGRLCTRLQWLYGFQRGSLLPRQETEFGVLKVSRRNEDWNLRSTVMLGAVGVACPVGQDEELKTAVASAGNSSLNHEIAGQRYQSQWARIT